MSVIKVEHMIVCSEWVYWIHQAGWHRRKNEFQPVPAVVLDLLSEQVFCLSEDKCEHKGS